MHCSEHRHTSTALIDQWLHAGGIVWCLAPPRGPYNSCGALGTRHRCSPSRGSGTVATVAPFFLLIPWATCRVLFCCLNRMYDATKAKGLRFPWDHQRHPRPPRRCRSVPNPCGIPPRPPHNGNASRRQCHRPAATRPGAARRAARPPAHCAARAARRRRPAGATTRGGGPRRPTNHGRWGQAGCRVDTVQRTPPPDGHGGGRPLRPPILSPGHHDGGCCHGLPVGVGRPHAPHACRRGRHGATAARGRPPVRRGSAGGRRQTAWPRTHRRRRGGGGRGAHPTRRPDADALAASCSAAAAGPRRRAGPARAPPPGGAAAAPPRRAAPPDRRRGRRTRPAGGEGAPRPRARACCGAAVASAAVAVGDGPPPGAARWHGGFANAVARGAAGDAGRRCAGGRTGGTPRPSIQCSYPYPGRGSYTVLTLGNQREARGARPASNDRL